MAAGEQRTGVCVVGHGMMGAWHAGALRRLRCALRYLVGRRPEATRASAKAHGFERWTTDLDEALRDEQVDVVVVANPSDQHARSALRALEHDKHVLVEIPIAMNLRDAEHLVAAAASRSLKLGAVHPLRARPELVALRRRIDAGEEAVRHVGGRFFIHRLENIGATGYRRSWTDNLLWHHTAHLLDAGLWLLQSSSPTIESFMPEPDPTTGIPMEVCLLASTDADQSLVCTGSYYARERIFDLLIITDRDSYRLDVFASTLTQAAGTEGIGSEEETCALLTEAFLDAVRGDGQLDISAEAVLPAMRALQLVQDRWDAAHGERSLPGRPLAGSGLPAT